MVNERSREITKHCSNENAEENIDTLHTLLRNTLDQSTNAAFFVKGKLRLFFVNQTSRCDANFGQGKFAITAPLGAQVDCLMGAAERLHVELSGPRKQGIFLTIYTTPEGQKIPLEISFSFVEHEGEKSGVCFIRNIDDNIKMPEIYSTDEWTFKVLAENSTDYISLHDLGGRIIYANQQIRKALNVSSDAIIRKTIFEVMPGTEPEKYMDAFRHTVTTGTNSDVEIVFPDHEPEMHHYFVRLIPERKSSGKITGVLSIGRDVTEHKRQEDELIKADKLESLSVFAGCIAHDFNNLLNVVMWSISRLGKNCGNISNLGIEDATEACQKAMELSHRLTSFAKGVVSNRKPISIGPILRESISLHRKHIDVYVDIADNLHVIDADETQLRQMFGNLAINAGEAMPDGGKLQVKAENVVTDNQSYPELPNKLYVRIVFSDKGCGIDESLLAKIFEPYFTTKPKGTGLGLASCSLIVSNHGGKIFVTSKPGVGSEFTVYLPACLGNHN